MCVKRFPLTSSMSRTNPQANGSQPPTQQPGPNRANDFVARSTGVAENSPKQPRPLTIRTRPPTAAAMAAPAQASSSSGDADDRHRQMQERFRAQQVRFVRPLTIPRTSIHIHTYSYTTLILFVLGRRPALITTTTTHRRPASRRGRRRGPSPMRTRTLRSPPGSSGASSAPRTTVRACPAVPYVVICGRAEGGGWYLSFWGCSSWTGSLRTAEVTRALDGIAQQYQEAAEGPGGGGSAENAQEALAKMTTKVRPFLRVLFDLNLHW